MRWPEFLQANGLPPDTRLTGSMGFNPRFPLHGEPLISGAPWWGCKEPERAYDEDERWDLGCPKCQLRMRMVLELEGGDIVVVNGSFANWPGVIAAIYLSVTRRGEKPNQSWKDAQPGSNHPGRGSRPVRRNGRVPQPEPLAAGAHRRAENGSVPQRKGHVLKRIAEYPDLRESLLGQLRTLDASGGQDCGWNPRPQ